MHETLLGVSTLLLLILLAVLIFQYIRLRERYIRLKERTERLELQMIQLESSNSGFKKATQDILRTFEKELDEVKDGVDERNKAEIKMFEGLSNIFNYDVTQAREAVRTDAEE